MTYGRLKEAFHPANEIGSLRSVLRQRAAQVQDQSRCVPHRQKALTPMNIQLDNVMSDLTGKTGLAILRRIVAGERDPEILATLRDRRLRASEQTVACSRQGNWREKYRFALAQVPAHDDFLGRRSPSATT